MKSVLVQLFQLKGRQAYFSLQMKFVRVGNQDWIGRWYLQQDCSKAIADTREESVAGRDNTQTDPSSTTHAW